MIPHAAPAPQRFSHCVRNAQVFLETLAGQAAIAIDNYLLAESRRFNAEMTLTYEATIEGWSRALDLRDRETQDHSRSSVRPSISPTAIMNAGTEPITRAD